MVRLFHPEPYQGAEFSGNPAWESLDANNHLLSWVYTGGEVACGGEFLRVVFIRMNCFA